MEARRKVNEGSEFKQLTESLLPFDGPANSELARSTSQRAERLVSRSNARSTVSFSHIDLGYFGYITDGFTTIVNARWSVIILVFCMTYTLSWLAFGLLWLGTESIYQHVYNETCITNVNKTFVSAFLFSLETQVTIGYGYRFIRDECGLGVVVLLIQCLVGLIIDSIMLGLVFTKLTRPRNRRKTIFFSNQAVIRTSPDGNRSLEFRMVDVRRSQLVEAHVRVTMYWYKKAGGTREPELEQYDLPVGYDTGEDRIILLAPVVIRHLITPSSPLHSINSQNLLNQDLEIVASLEGIVESTGLTAQALWSYTEREIMIGYKFKPMIHRKRGGKRSWDINCSLVSQVERERTIEEEEEERHE